MKIDLQALIKWAEKKGSVPGVIMLARWVGDELTRRAIKPGEQFSYDDLVGGWKIIGGMDLGDASVAYEEIVQEKTKGNGDKTSGGQSLMPESREQKKGKVAGGMKALTQRFKSALLVLWGAILWLLFLFISDLYQAWPLNLFLNTKIGDIQDWE